MKNLTSYLVAVLVVSLLASCGSSPYKRRKSCRGKGGWYGNRNLGSIDRYFKEKKQKTYYVKKEDLEVAEAGI